MSNQKQHWENVYQKPVTELGWFQEKAEPSLGLIQKWMSDKSKSIIDVGSGASVLIKNLLEEGYSHVTALDISAKALEDGKANLSQNQGVQVNWVVADLTDASNWPLQKQFDVWHDRAVLHFLLTEEEQQAYKTILEKTLPIGGFAIISTFSQNGAQKCSGLPIKQYDVENLNVVLGTNFELKESFDFTHFNPRGEERAHIYTIYQKVK
jgi:2-polyprenyl-3-methyl-5-hydroxy-6-metoxy-1,4-benzoquinol methylase